MVSDSESSSTVSEASVSSDELMSEGELNEIAQALELNPEERDDELSCGVIGDSELAAIVSDSEQLDLDGIS